MVNRLRLQVFVAAIGLFAIAVALAYFLLVVTPVQVPARGGTYVEGVIADSSAQVSINPLVAQPNTFNQDVTALVFSGLTRSVPGPTPNDPGQVIEPDLARSWTSSADGKTWEFQLRQDVRWQDGTPITARDVLYTFGLLKSEDYPDPSRQNTLWKTVEVSRLGDYGVRFQLQQPRPAFLSYTTIGLVPAHKLEGKIKPAELGRTEFNQAPVGSGPYELAPGGLSPTGVTLIANPLYHGQKPFLDKIWFRFYPSASAALSALQANQIDGVSEVSPNEAQRVESLKNITEFEAPRSRSTFLYLNLQRQALFGQKEVRQSLAYAINKTALVEQALSGQARPSQSPILPTSWAYKAGLKTYGFDPARAERMLDEAGWRTIRDGVRERNGQSLNFRLLTYGSPEYLAVANSIRDNLRTIKVAAQIETVGSLTELQTALQTSSYDAVLFTVQGEINDPDQYTAWHSSYADAGENHTNYANWRLDRADKLLENARATIVQDDRRKLYGEWQDIFAEEMPSIPLYYSTYTYIVSNRVGGVEGSNLKVLNFASDRLKDINLRYVFTATRFGT